MKKKKLPGLFILICLILSLARVNAQQVNTMYFMDNVPYRNTLNPAFQPYSNFYLGLLPIGYTQIGIENNSLVLKDIATKDQNGNLTFSTTNLLSLIKSNTLVNTNLHLNLLSFGFRTGKSYWNFSLTQKLDFQLSVPKDAVNLALNGLLVNSYDLTNLGLDLTLFTEAGLGYARKFNDKWSVGAKVKLLYGNANINFQNEKLLLSSGTNSLAINGKGEIQISSAANFTGLNIPSTFPGASDFIKPSGLGAGIDLGVTYNPIKNLTFSAAITDLGMISWNRNVNRTGYTINYNYTGNMNIDTLFNKQVTPFINSADTTNINKSYSTYTRSKLNIGAEYGFFDNKLSIGLLSRTMLHRSILLEELTASVNVKPIDWFNLTGSYSILNGRMSNIGLGLGIRTGFIHWFVSSDFVPLNYANIPLPAGVPILKSAPVPYNTHGVNFAFGFNIVFGNSKDADKDGVVDRKDKCPDSPLCVKVDKNGCPVDSDGDGVPDYLDKCPDTPKEAYGKIDSNGCPIDTDGDGVPDYLDKCPDTPKEAIGFVDKDGCPRDSDGDGVPDYLDKCKDTPAGVKVDQNGCPLDTDGDGVPDYLDKCPDTPKEANRMVDKNGCLLDSDGDGVPDYLDLCPNTPAEAKGFVDKNGCLLDTDGDGISDYLDKCSDTPIAARGMVDQNGCPRDTDGDGIPDYLDKCPTIPGVASNNGCPEIKKEVKTLFQKALQGIQFETAKFKIKPVSFGILNQIANVLILNPSYLIEIQGHTDNAGKPESNLILSDKRAQAVKDYLISKGVEAKRMTSRGYGDTVPVASNKKPKGRALNRRVEFIISFEQVVQQ